MQSKAFGESQTTMGIKGKPHNPPDISSFGECNIFVSQGTKVATPDGIGTTIGVNFRKNTNGGPGTRQYCVQLLDGRIRHYSHSEVVKVKNNVNIPQ